MAMDVVCATSTSHKYLRRFTYECIDMHYLRSIHLCVLVPLKILFSCGVPLTLFYLFLRINILMVGNVKAS